MAIYYVDYGCILKHYISVHLVPSDDFAIPESLILKRVLPIFTEKIGRAHV